MCRWMTTTARTSSRMSNPLNTNASTGKVRLSFAKSSDPTTRNGVCTTPPANASPAISNVHESASSVSIGTRSGRDQIAQSNRPTRQGASATAGLPLPRTTAATVATPNKPTRSRGGRDRTPLAIGSGSDGLTAIGRARLIRSARR